MRRHVASVAGDTPIQIQVGNQTASGQTVAQVAATLRSLATSLQARASDAAAQAEKVTPSILELQGKSAQVLHAQEELSRTQSLAESQYLTLAAKVNQVQIAAQDAGSTIRVVSGAAIPQKASDLGLGPVVLVGAVAGLLLGVLLVLALEWLRPAAELPLSSTPSTAPPEAAAGRTN